MNSKSHFPTTSIKEFTVILLMTIGVFSCSEDEPINKQLTVSTFTPTFILGGHLVIDKEDMLYCASVGAVVTITPDANVTTLPDMPTGYPFFYYPDSYYYKGLALDKDGALLALAEDMHISEPPELIFNIVLGGARAIKRIVNNRSGGHYGIAIDKQGNIYVGTWTQGLYKLEPNATELSLLAGGVYGYADGVGADAMFSNISDIAIDESGTIYVADYKNHCIRKVTASGEVSTLAGTNEPGFKNGKRQEARFSNPLGIAVDKKGNVYVTEEANHSVRKITPAGVVTTIAGTGTQGYVDGPAATAQFYYPVDIAVNSQGHLFVSDSGNDRIRVIK